MIKHFIKGTDFELLHINSVADQGTTWFTSGTDRFVIPFEWVEERKVLEPEPPRYTILYVRSKSGADRASTHEARQRRSTPEWDRWYSSSANTYGLTWEELNEEYEIVGVVYKPEEE